MVVTIHEAKTHLSRLLHRVELGEEVIIARGKVPVAVLRSVSNPDRRVPGRNRGKIWMADDFDAPLAEFQDYMP